jgi:putative toxin-antitoxin system antitoxin component (TIGR02293 family)
MKKKKLKSKQEIVLTERGAESLFRALAYPSKPNAALKKAFAHKRLVNNKDKPKKMNKINIQKAVPMKDYENASGLKNMFKIIQDWPLKKSHLNFISEKFRLTKKQTSAIVGISTSTLQRWKPSTNVSPLIAEAILKLAELYDNGMMVFDDDEESFRAWIRTSVPSLNHRLPINLLDTRTGIELVNEQLLKMEHAVT